MAYVKLELLCKVMGEGSLVDSHFPVRPRSSDLFRVSTASTLVSPVLCAAALGEGMLQKRQPYR